MEQDEIIIRKAIIHILDSSNAMPVLSDYLLELSPDLNDFLRSHIYKIASSDDIKECSFNKDESTIYKCIENFNEDKLISMSQEIACHLYTIMNQNIAITAADLFIVTYQVHSNIHLAILKMNYKESYIHYVSSGDIGNYNDVIKQKVNLPSETTKLTEAVLIDLSDFSIALVEKKYEVNGLKTNYLSELFLQCKTKLSPKSKLNIITKAVEQINQKYFEEDYNKQMETKAIIHQEYLEQGTISVENLSEKIFTDQVEIKEEFTDKLKKYNLETEEVKPQNRQTVKKYDKQFLTTDTGIEINIPMEEYLNKKNVEFINNIDGTISVMINNISWITTK